MRLERLASERKEAVAGRDHVCGRPRRLRHGHGLLIWQVAGPVVHWLHCYAEKASTHSPRIVAVISAPAVSAGGHPFLCDSRASCSFTRAGNRLPGLGGPVGPCSPATVGADRPLDIPLSARAGSDPGIDCRRLAFALSRARRVRSSARRLRSRDARSCSRSFVMIIADVSRALASDYLVLVAGQFFIVLARGGLRQTCDAECR